MSDRLLTREEMAKALENARLSPYANPYQERCVIAQAQRDLTASIVRREMVEEIEKEFRGMLSFPQLIKWQELKRKWGILPTNPVGFVDE